MAPKKPSVESCWGGWQEARYAPITPLPQTEEAACTGRAVSSGQEESHPVAVAGLCQQKCFGYHTGRIIEL